jgi:hypothetical protein
VQCNTSVIRPCHDSPLFPRPCPMNCLPPTPPDSPVPRYTRCPPQLTQVPSPPPKANRHHQPLSPVTSVADTHSTRRLRRPRLSSKGDFPSLLDVFSNPTGIFRRIKKLSPIPLPSPYINLARSRPLQSPCCIVKLISYRPIIKLSLLDLSRSGNTSQQYI